MRGLALVGGLLEGCVDHGVTLVTDARATALLVDDDGRVQGLGVEQGDEVETYAAAGGVVLASGGFEWNKVLWDSFMAVPWDGPSSPPYNEGDGLVMAMGAGARLANMNRATWIPSRFIGEEWEGRRYMRNGLFGGWPGEILVNRKGKRFTNETLNYNDIGIPMTEFDSHSYEFVNHPCFLIGDARRLRAPTEFVSDDPNAPEELGDHLVEADTLRELAEKLGIDPEGLEEQVREFNKYAEEGHDPVFHRGEKSWELHIQPKTDLPNKSIAPLVEPPFVGHRVRAGVFGTRGGPVINAEAKIVDVQNEPIAGLFGAGNVIAHPFGTGYPGGGGTLGPAVTFGHIAGRSAARAKAETS